MFFAKAILTVLLATSIAAVDFILVDVDRGEHPLTILLSPGRKGPEVKLQFDKKVKEIRVVTPLEGTAKCYFGAGIAGSSGGVAQVHPGDTIVPVDTYLDQLARFVAVCVDGV